LLETVGWEQEWGAFSTGLIGGFAQSVQFNKSGRFEREPAPTTWDWDEFLPNLSPIDDGAVCSWMNRLTFFSLEAGSPGHRRHEHPAITIGPKNVEGR
jgi:hypothetical protein